MDGLVKVLTDFGPFSAPVNVVLLAGLAWLAKDRARVLSERDVALADARALREKRAEDLRVAAIEYREHSEATRDIVREWTTHVRALLDARREL